MEAEHMSGNSPSSGESPGGENLHETNLMLLLAIQNK